MKTVMHRCPKKMLNCSFKLKRYTVFSWQVKSRLSSLKKTKQKKPTKNQTAWMFWQNNNNFLWGWRLGGEKVGGTLSKRRVNKRSIKTHAANFHPHKPTETLFRNSPTDFKTSTSCFFLFFSSSLFLNILFVFFIFKLLSEKLYTYRFRFKNKTSFYNRNNNNNYRCYIKIRYFALAEALLAGPKKHMQRVQAERAGLRGCQSQWLGLKGNTNKNIKVVSL